MAKPTQMYVGTPLDVNPKDEARIKKFYAERKQEVCDETARLLDEFIHGKIHVVKFITGLHNVVLTADPTFCGETGDEEE